ncbi:hypothetical protein SNE35_25295 [Paucibacter sp. R3-3]|uniref:Uncharacterized protein n=1 Tax=Roseateles agri TaxID=3098619 RepID=A0ABU5DQ56_9BURK|nr:hypothetical protein [Paucibacter sp. R3-3]MDY0747843.1 hypothetical protein [Paucibacter sp. R3-3]
MAGSEATKTASPKTIVWIERLVWILIYGGLLVMSLGLFLVRGEGPVLGSVLLVKGGIATAAGVFLIWLRSRLKQTPND